MVACTTFLPNSESPLQWQLDTSPGGGVLTVGIGWHYRAGLPDSRLSWRACCYVPALHCKNPHLILELALTCPEDVHLVSQCQCGLALTDAMTPASARAPGLTHFPPQKAEILFLLSRNPVSSNVRSKQRPAFD